MLRPKRLFPASPFLLALLVFALLNLGGSVAQAQSGRRTQKGVPSPAPVPAPPDPQPSPAPRAQPQISLFVVSDIPQSVYLSVNFPERIPGWVVKRLKDSSALKVTG